MDENLYANLLKEGKFTSIYREYSRERQLQGIDVTVNSRSSSVNIDEKAQLYYINKDLPTFAFELQFLRGGEATTGWLLNDCLLTDLYLLIWPFAKVDDLALLRKDNITHLDALLVSKESVRNFLDDKGLTAAKMQSQIVQLRRSGIIGRYNTEIQGVYYFVSSRNQYAEGPINIVIKKSYLEEIAEAHYDIYPGGFSRYFKYD